jgi:hypothetical protein
LSSHYLHEKGKKAASLADGTLNADIRTAYPSQSDKGKKGGPNSTGKPKTGIGPL